MITSFTIHAPHLGPKIPTPPPPAVEPAPVRVRLEEPSALELAENFVGAMERWSAAGFPTLTRAQYDARAAACETCELWDGAARLGLGKCNAPGCGCTRFKRWLRTEQCKHPAGSRWPELKPLSTKENS